MSELQSLTNSNSVETENAQMSYIAVWNICSVATYIYNYIYILMICCSINIDYLCGFFDD